MLRFIGIIIFFLQIITLNLMADVKPGTFTGVPLAAPPQVSKNWEDFGLDLSAGFAYLEGNVDFLSFVSGISIDAHYGKHSFYIDGGNKYTETNDNRILNKINGTFLYTYFLGEHMNFYFSSAHVFNEFTRLDYRLTNGPGICVHNFFKPTFNIFLIAVGVNYENEWFDDNSEEEAVTGVIRWTFEIPVSKNAKIGSDFVYIQMFDDVRDFRLYEEAYLEVKITEKILSLRISIIDEYDSQPLENVEKNDFGVFASLILHLGDGVLFGQKEEKEKDKEA